MAAPKKAPKKAEKKADAPSPAKVAKLRRDGATWSQVREALGVRTSSGAFTTALHAAGYGPDGLKLDGSGPRESKARVKGSTQPAKADAPDAGKEGK